MIRQSLRLGGSNSGPDAPKESGLLSDALGRSRLGTAGNRRDRLQDLGSDLVGVALGVRAAIFQIALVAVIGEAVGHADRSAAVGDAIAELMDRSGFVLAGQPQMVVRTVDRDVFFAVGFERLHQLLEILLAA